MTNEQDPKSGESANDSVAGGSDVVGDITPLDPQTEALVTAALASLPPLTMPQDVHERLLAAIAAEPNPYAAPASEQAATSNVTAIPTQRKRSNGWFVGVAGVAAASVLGLVIGTSVLDGESGPTAPITAAAIPMSATSNEYKKETFTTQVAAALPKWRTAAVAPESTTDAVPSVSPSDLVYSPAPQPSGSVADPGDVAPSAMPSASVRIIPVDKRMREQVAACLSRISSRAPMHVEIATYVATPTAPAEAVAVAAVSGANESVDVYAIKVSCATDDPQIVREHVTLNSQ